MTFVILNDYKMDEEIEYLDDETTCAICQAEFLDTGDLNIHTTQIHRNEECLKRFCNLCHSIFPDIQDYVIHIRDYHLKTLQWCRHCTRVFFNNEDLKQHEIKHGASKLKSCSQCEQSFLNKNELESHEFTDHINYVSSEGIMLQDCFSLLSSALNMNVRKFFSVPYTHTSYSCAICGLITSDIDVYSEHLRSESKISYTCDKCCNVYKEKYKLARHLQGASCQDSNKNLKECTMCKKKLNIRLFNKHVKHCLGLNCVPYDAAYFDSLTSCTDQLQGVQKSIPLLTCKFCHRQFVGKVALYKHIDRTHKASFHLYKYKCVDCDHLFNHPKLLFSHYFSRHKDLQPYTCTICNKKFRVRKAFTLHIKLDHETVGFVEFDENYHVFFSDKKSENPFHPQSLVNPIVDDLQNDTVIDETTNDTLEGKEYGTHEIDIINVNSDFMNATETECETDVDKTKQRKTTKRKRPVPVNKKKIISLDEQSYETEVSSNDSDTPLINIKKSKPRIVHSYSKPQTKKKFICKKCDKNCYTYQNYHHHMSLHAGCKLKKCIKCDKKFKTQNALKKHIEKKHTSSKLTETLKQLLERRKNPNSSPKDRQSLSEGFRRSIHKVQSNGNCNTAAKITLVENGLSAKKFLETFAPDETSKDIKITHCITLKEVFGANKCQTIKLTKFNPEPVVLKRKLRMPVKFKQEDNINVKASIKLVQKPVSAVVTKPALALTTDVNHVDHSYTDFYENDDMILADRQEIPEVAEEVMLDDVEQEREHRVIETQSNIIIPNLPENCADVRIGHLQAQAPYYKIVKMKDVLKTTEEPKKQIVESPPRNVTLPDGTKLVSVNPLAHLLRNTNVENIVKVKKHYEPKIKDIRTAIEKAMKSAYKPKRKNGQNIC